MLLINCCWDCLWPTLPPIWSEFACSSDYLSLNTIALSSLIHPLIIFHCPQLIWILFVFLLKVHCIAPKRSTFQGASRSVDFILVKDFANSIDILLVWQSLCSGINSHTSKIMSIQSLVVGMKTERCQFLKVFLKIKLLRSKIQHTLFNAVLWLSCILKTQMTRCKIQMTFSWFFVSVLIFDLGYIFWWSTMRWPSMNFKKQDAQVKTEALSRNVVFFFSTNFISMHNDQ